MRMMDEQGVIDAMKENKANKALPKLAMTNGVPARLAAARARRNAEKVSRVDVIEANKARRPNL